MKLLKEKLGNILSNEQGKSKLNALRGVRKDNAKMKIKTEKLGEKKIGKKRNLKEQVSDEAYQIADEINKAFEGSEFISRGDFDDKFVSCLQGIYGDANIDWEESRLPNGEDIYDLEMDVRGILAYDGWNTILEGEDEGGLEQLNSERPRINELIYNALREYEEKHNTSEGRSWQRVMNKLIDYYDMHMTDEHDIEKYGYLDESCKSKKKSKKLNETWKGEDVITDLVDRAQSLIDDGNYGDVDDCITQAIDDGLIYSRDIWDLAEHYGVVDDSELIERYYEELFSDIYSRVEEKKEDEEIDESLKESNEDKKYKWYGWFLNDNDELEISIIDKNDNEKLLATISDCGGKTKRELDNLAQEVIEENDYTRISEPSKEDIDNEKIDESLHVEIDEDTALYMLMNRLSHWTQDPISEELYEQMYQSYIDGGVFDGGEFDPMIIVDNDWVNYCEIVEPGDEEYHYDELLKLYEEQGLGDVSTEDVGFSYIEAAVERNGKVYFLCRW